MPLTLLLVVGVILLWALVSRYGPLRLEWPTVLFLGWFGPYGIASLLFGLILLEESDVAHRTALFDVVILTVLTSVVLHGLSATPLARAYGAWVERHADSSATD